MSDAHDAARVESAEWWLSGIKRVRRIAALLVVIGVGGELLADRIAEPFRKVIEDVRQEELTRLNNETTAARLEQERLKAANLALEQLIQPRRLTPENVVALRCVMAKFPDQKFGLSATAMDLESLHLAIQLQDVLRDAQWNDDGKLIDTELQTDVGVNVTPGGAPNDGIVAEDLISVLNEIGLHAHVGRRTGEWSGPLHIHVGVKPLPEKP